MTATTEAALDLATDLLWTQNDLGDIAQTLSEGKYKFSNGLGDVIDCEDELERLANEAFAAHAACLFAGLEQLSEFLARLDLMLRRLALVSRMGVREVATDLNNLWGAAQEQLAKDEAILAPIETVLVGAGK